MHNLNHVFSHRSRLENTPPGIGTVKGESDVALERLLFGGHFELTWPTKDAVGNFSHVERTTLRAPDDSLFIISM
jgi:hypothetical protein